MTSEAEMGLKKWQTSTSKQVLRYDLKNMQV
jgi:hypothetical protein